MKRVVVAALSLLLLTGCAETLAEVTGPEYSGEDLSADVLTAVNRNAEQYGFNRKADRADSADCEDVPVVEKGALADCTLTMEDGSDIYVRVRFQDKAGHFVVNAV